MVDGVLKWAKQQRRIWVREIGLLESGKKTTSEVRRGKIVDATGDASENLDKPPSRFAHCAARPIPPRTSSGSEAAPRAREWQTKLSGRGAHVADDLNPLSPT